MMTGVEFTATVVGVDAPFQVADAPPPCLWSMWLMRPFLCYVQILRKEASMQNDQITALLVEVNHLRGKVEW